MSRNGGFFFLLSYLALIYFVADFLLSGESLPVSVLRPSSHVHQLLGLFFYRTNGLAGWIEGEILLKDCTHEVDYSES